VSEYYDPYYGRPHDPDVVHYPLRPDQPPNGPSEFAWGPGLTMPGLENASPAEGGMYKGTTPPSHVQICVDLDT
jgi:hypothetical protein